MPDVEGVVATVAWQRLEQALTKARSDGGLSASISAIDAVCEFVKSVRPTGGEWLATPLITLNMALAMLPKGVVAPILRPAISDGRPLDTFGRQQIKAYAAAAMTNLMDWRLSRRNAGEKVAEVLDQHKFLRSGGHRVTWKTVAEWRDELKNGETGDAVSALYHGILHSRRDPAHPMWLGQKRGWATPGQYVLAELSSVISRVDAV